MALGVPGAAAAEGVGRGGVGRAFGFAEEGSAGSLGGSGRGGGAACGSDAVAVDVAASVGALIGGGSASGAPEGARRTNALDPSAIPS